MALYKLCSLALVSLLPTLGAVLRAQDQVTPKPKTSSSSTKQAPKNQASIPTVTLAVLCDLACTWTLDGEEKGSIAAGASGKAKVELGQHVVLTRTLDGQDATKQALEITKLGQALVEAQLAPVRAARLAKLVAAQTAADEQRRVAEAAAEEQRRKSDELAASLRAANSKLPLVKGSWKNVQQFQTKQIGCHSTSTGRVVRLARVDHFNVRTLIIVSERQGNTPGTRVMLGNLSLASRRSLANSDVCSDFKTEGDYIRHDSRTFVWNVIIEVDPDSATMVLHGTEGKCVGGDCTVADRVQDDVSWGLDFSSSDQLITGDGLLFDR